MPGGLRATIHSDAETMPERSRRRNEAQMREDYATSGWTARKFGRRIRAGGSKQKKKIGRGTRSEWSLGNPNTVFLRIQTKVARSPSIKRETGRPLKS